MGLGDEHKMARILMMIVILLIFPMPDMVLPMMGFIVVRSSIRVLVDGERVDVAKVVGKLGPGDVMDDGIPVESLGTDDKIEDIGTTDIVFVVGETPFPGSEVGVKIAVKIGIAMGIVDVLMT